MIEWLLPIRSPRTYYKTRCEHSTVYQDYFVRITPQSGEGVSLVTKNRFGEADSVGIFRMTERGMASIDNPSKIFLSRMIEDGPGSAITCIRDGNRQLLVEIQSLVTATDSDFAQRVSMGVNMNRLKILAAILKKHGRMSMNNDIYLSVIGGLKINEMDSSADLAIAASLYSSYKEKAIDSDTCMLGELSLAGEVRPISNGVQRVQEAVKHGFKTIYIPKSNYHPTNKKYYKNACQPFSIDLSPLC